jgi:hypothetical protein
MWNEWYQREMHRVLVGKPEGKRLFGICVWEVNIELCLKDTGWQGMDWINVAEDGDKWQSVVSMVMNIWNC